MPTVTESQLRKQFFQFVFGDNEGYVCIATQKPSDRASFKQSFFEWPGQTGHLTEFVDRESKNKNIWFGVNLLTAPERTKQFCSSHNIVWADLDSCNPDKIEPKPQCVIQSSPERWQAIWRLDETIDPYLAEQYSKKIAYKYKEEGADPSGWDLTQLLRVPFTLNFKYANAPKIILNEANPVLCPAEIFEALAVEIPTSDDPLEIEMPDVDSLPDSIGIIYKFQNPLRGTAFNELYDSEPPDDADWSKLLWRLVNICIEAGMSQEETFAVCKDAKCNKYNRDGRPIRFLWREVVKADTQQRRLNILALNNYVPLAMPQLITQDELESLAPTFIDEYREWGTDATDAVVDYHNLSAFMLLSFFTAANVRLPTSNVTMVPNIWGLVLGDSTLTRKTTAMSMAMDFVAELDRDLVLATDGSAEGILTGLSGRPSRVSIYYRDEVTGFFESMQKKDYMAGMKETFTQLYDVPEFYNRRLRKEVIEIVKPVFIFFGGGIKERLYQLVTEEFILSGFMPRFIIVSGEADLSRVRRTGPPATNVLEAKSRIKEHLANLYESYSVTTTMTIGGQTIIVPTTVTAELTPEAWFKYGEIEGKMVEAAHGSPIAMLAMPTFERLSRSMLKMAVLLASSRQTPSTDLKITVEERDIIGAAKYMQGWGAFSVDLLMNSGRSVMQRTIDKVLRTVGRRPGVTRSEVARAHQFTKRDMDEVIATLLDRGEIRLEPAGRGYKLWLV